MQSKRTSLLAAVLVATVGILLAACAPDPERVQMSDPWRVYRTETRPGRAYVSLYTKALVGRFDPSNPGLGISCSQLDHGRPEVTVYWGQHSWKRPSGDVRPTSVPRWADGETNTAGWEPPQRQGFLRTRIIWNEETVNEETVEEGEWLLDEPWSTFPRFESEFIRKLLLSETVSIRTWGIDDKSQELKFALHGLPQYLWLNSDICDIRGLLGNGS